MHDAIRSMLTHYDCRTRDDHVNALREILQYMAFTWKPGCVSREIIRITIH